MIRLGSDKNISGSVRNAWQKGICCKNLWAGMWGADIEPWLNLHLCIGSSNKVTVNTSPMRLIQLSYWSFTSTLKLVPIKITMWRGIRDSCKNLWFLRGQKCVFVSYGEGGLHSLLQRFVLFQKEGTLSVYRWIVAYKRMDELSK